MRLGHYQGWKKPVVFYLVAHSYHSVIRMELLTSQHSRSAVFLDRDGVINEMVYNPEFGLVDSPANPKEFTLLPGVGDAVRKLNLMGVLVIVVSNQPGVAKGRYSLALHNAMTEKMHLELTQAGAKLDAVYYCLHHPEAKLAEYHKVCECRKPKPGMLWQAVRDWNINLPSSYLIGDGVTDIVAGQAVGVSTVFVGSYKPYILNELDKQNAHPDYFVNDLTDAVETLQKMGRHYE